MFRIDQILTATTFIRSFKEVAQRLLLNPEPLLITKRDGGFIVIMDGVFSKISWLHGRNFSACQMPPKTLISPFLEPNTVRGKDSGLPRGH